MLPIFHASVVGLMILLLGGHYLADFPLQGPYLSEAKNSEGPLGQGGVWVHALAGHAMIHTFFVFVFTGSVQCAIIEFVSHAAIDHAKCNNWLSYNTDQALHIGLKAFYVFAITVLGFYS